MVLGEARSKLSLTVALETMAKFNLAEIDFHTSGIAPIRTSWPVVYLRKAAYITSVRDIKRT